MQEENKNTNINKMALHEIIEFNEAPYFRVMKVDSGWLYNFYDVEKDAYEEHWVFVPLKQYFQG